MNLLTYFIPHLIMDNNIQSSNICRLCLKSAVSFENISSNEILHDKIDTLFKLNIDKNDKFSQLVCNDCLRLIDQFWNYYHIVISNQMILETPPFLKTPQIEDRSKMKKPVRKPDKINDQLPEHLKVRKTSGTSDAKIKQFIKLHCTLCGANSDSEFANFKALQEHYVTEHKCRGFVECCDRRFYRKDRLIDHITFHTDPNAFKCPQCGHKSKNKLLLKSHMKQHLPVDEWKYQCNQCSNRFVLKSQLSNHEATHFTESQKKYVCDECGKSFAHQFVMLKHKERHSTERNYICDICARTFVSKANLQCHIAKHNAPDMVNVRVQCKICQSWYKNRDTLRTHMHCHRDKRDHRCEVCQKLCATRSALVAHIRYVHLNLHEFECTICDRKFRRKLELTEHMARHSGKPLYQCKICSKTFASSSSYFSHRKKQHARSAARNPNSQDVEDTQVSHINGETRIAEAVVVQVIEGTIEPTTEGVQLAAKYVVVQSNDFPNNIEIRET